MPRRPLDNPADAPKPISKSSAVVLQGAAKLIGLVLQFLYVRRRVQGLGDSSYNAFIYAGSCAAFIGLAEFGLPGAVQRYIGEAMSRGDMVRVSSLFRFAWRMHALYAVGALAVFGGFAAIYSHSVARTPSDPGIALFAICGLQAVTLLVTSPATSIAAALDRFREVATFNFVQGVLTPALGLTVVYFIRKPEAVAASALVGSVVSTILVYRMCGAHVLPPAETLTRDEKRALFSLSGRGYPTTITTTLGNNADKIMVQQAGIANSLEHYAIAGRIPEQIYQVIMPITSTVYPELARLAPVNEEAFTRALERNIRFTLVLALSLSVVPCAFSECILRFWMHSRFVDANPGAIWVVPLMGMYRGLELVFGVMTTAYFAKGRPQYVLPFSIFNACATVFGTVPMYRWGGIAGVGLMNALIDLLQIIPMSLMLKRFAAPQVRLSAIAIGFASVLAVVLGLFGGIHFFVDGPLSHTYPGIGFFASPFAGVLAIIILVRLRVCDVPERMAARLRRLPLGSLVFGLKAGGQA